MKPFLAYNMKNNKNIKTGNIFYIHITANKRTYPGFSVSTVPLEGSTKLNFFVESSLESSNRSWIS
jgi:hypothetical protein